MANYAYLVIRLVDSSPANGATFGMYLDDLRLQVADGNTKAALRKFAYSSPLILLQWPPGIGGQLSVACVPTSESTAYDSVYSNYGSTLTFGSTDGISVGSYVFSSDQATMRAGSILQVIEVTAANSSRPAKVQLNSPPWKYLPTGTAVSFFGRSPSDDPWATPAFSFPLSTNSPAPTADGNPVKPPDPLVVLQFADTRWNCGSKPGLGRAIWSVYTRRSLARRKHGRPFTQRAGDGNLDLVDFSAPLPGVHKRTMNHKEE